MQLKRVVSEITGTVFTLPYLVARDEGYFAEEGIELELVAPRRAETPVTEDHHLISSTGSHELFESGAASLYRACEWGQVRRSHDSLRGGRVISKRAAVASQAIFVRPDSPVSHPQDLAGRGVAVNFHHGSHYIAIQTLEGFLPREEIRVVHVGGPRERFEALRDGRIEAAAVMEPWITVAEKLGYKLIAEAFYVGSEIASPDLDAETYAAVNRAIRKAVRRLQQDPRPYLHYLIEDVPEDVAHLEPQDFRIGRLRYVDPEPYPEKEFQRTYDWMVSWGLIDASSSYEQLVDNRIAVG